MSDIDPSQLKNQDKSVIVNPTPTVLSIRDVVVVLGVIFAIASSYFTSDNRHTTNESNIRSSTEQVSGLKSRMEDLEKQHSDTRAEFRVNAEQHRTTQNEMTELKSRVKDLERGSKR